MISLHLLNPGVGERDIDEKKLILREVRNDWTEFYELYLERLTDFEKLEVCGNLRARRISSEETLDLVSQTYFLLSGEPLTQFV